MNKFKSKNQPTSEKKELGLIPTLLIALLCAGFIRSFFFEPFHIPSSSMKPGLLIGDYIFVSKYSYGYSRYSFPFGLKIFSGRFFSKQPQRGDIVVFRFPQNPQINYIKRLIGFPGDRIQMRHGVLFINDHEVPKVENDVFIDEVSGLNAEIPQFIETLPEGVKFSTLDEIPESDADNTEVFVVPHGHYFMMGDNRDNSQDSRFLSHVGFVPEENLVGKAQIIFFSTKNPIWQFWHWPSGVRGERLFKKLS